MLARRLTQRRNLLLVTIPFPLASKILHFSNDFNCPGRNQSTNEIIYHDNNRRIRAKSVADRVKVIANKMESRSGPVAPPELWRRDSGKIRHSTRCRFGGRWLLIGQLKRYTLIKHLPGEEGEGGRRRHGRQQQHLKRRESATSARGWHLPRS